VPAELGHLLAKPADPHRFSRVWPYLCSEGTAWPAAYAAVPHAVELAAKLPPEQRLEPLFFVGRVVQCSSGKIGDGDWEIRPFLLEAYCEALAAALPLIAEMVAVPFNKLETRYLLATMAALKGHVGLAQFLDDFDSIGDACPKCGEWVYCTKMQELCADEDLE
jgi:hypothetical protein